MKKVITFFSFCICIASISAELPDEKLDSYQLEASQKYKWSIAFKVSADLADTYSRCANLYTGIYGYLSNNPTSSWSKFPLQDFIQSAKTYSLLALEIEQEIIWSGDSNLDKGLNRTLFYKDLVSRAEDDVSLKPMINAELIACRDALEKDS